MSESCKPDWPANYHIGLPAWAFPGWKHVYFDNQPNALVSYARVFNTVEGNTTFYHVPTSETVAQWLESVESTGLKLCLKLPSSVTHHWPANLAELELFFKRIEPLKNNLGPFLLQFPASMGPQDLKLLSQLLGRLPPCYRYTIEVRHPAFFSHPEKLEDLIEQFQLGRVFMDSRAIFHGDLTHPEVQAARHEKPDVPVLEKVYNELVFVRLLLHPDLPSNRCYLDEWVSRLARHITNGFDCYMMIHCPNNLYCPPLALEFHQKLRAHLQQQTMVGLGGLPPFPVPQQDSLF